MEKWIFNPSKMYSIREGKIYPIRGCIQMGRKTRRTRREEGKKGRREEGKKEMVSR